MRNFSAATSKTGIQVAVTTASQAVQVATTPFELAAPDLLIDNRGAADVYVRAGNSDVVAVTTDLRVPAGAIMVYDKGANTSHLALIGAAGSTVVIQCGGGG